MPAISISSSVFRYIRRTLVPSQSSDFCLSSKFPFKCSIRQIYMDNHHHPNDSRGALIVLEGLDRCGKTSQSKRLFSYLEGLGHSIESWRFPDRTTSVGQMISSYLSNESQLDDHTIHLLFSANRWEKRSLMEAKLRSGTTLIVDRYSYSGVAFTSAKGLDIEWCKAPEVGLLAPDLVLYLEITPEKAAERGGYGTERYEKVEFQKKVAECYHILRDDSWKIVDATLPIEEIEKQLGEVALDCVTTCKKDLAAVSMMKPKDRLWVYIGMIEDVVSGSFRDYHSCWLSMAFFLGCNALILVDPNWRGRSELRWFPLPTSRRVEDAKVRSCNPE